MNETEYDISFKDFIYILKLQRYYKRRLANKKQNYYDTVKSKEINSIYTSEIKDQLIRTNTISKKQSINEVKSSFKELSKANILISESKKIQVKSIKPDTNSLYDNSCNTSNININRMKTPLIDNPFSINNNLNENKHKKINWEDGSWFYGEIKNSKANGIGIFHHVTGDEYEGHFQNDRSEGFGIYTNAENTSKCYSDWKNDYQNGIGMEIWEDRSIYIGEFKDGKKYGVGCYQWSDGSKYEGEFKDGYLHGYGIYYYNKIKKFYGQWNNNKMEGYGEFYWENHLYIGNYINDKKDGFGIYFNFHPIKVYIGMWKKGKQEGFGKAITTSNFKYAIWENGLKSESLNSGSKLINAYIEATGVNKTFFNMTLTEIRNFIEKKYISND